MPKAPTAANDKPANPGRISPAGQGSPAACPSVPFVSGATPALQTNLIKGNYRPEAFRKEERPPGDGGYGRSPPPVLVHKIYTQQKERHQFNERKQQPACRRCSEGPSSGSARNSTCFSAWASRSSWGCTAFRRRSCSGDFPPGANPDSLGALEHIAAWVELVSAFLIGLGVLTRLGAGALMVTMVVAYFGVHANNGLWPHQFPADGGFAAHGGEVPLLWFLIAGIIGVLVSRKWGIERLLFKRELLWQVAGGK